MTTQDSTAVLATRIGAYEYLLHSLLQRLGQQQPGLITKMMTGVLNDRNTIASDSSVDAQGLLIAEEALRMLELMNAQLKMERES